MPNPFYHTKLPRHKPDPVPLRALQAAYQHLRATGYGTRWHPCTRAQALLLLRLYHATWQRWPTTRTMSGRYCLPALHTLERLFGSWQEALRVADVPERTGDAYE